MTHRWKKTIFKSHIQQTTVSRICKEHSKVNSKKTIRLNLLQQETNHV